MEAQFKVQSLSHQPTNAIGMSTNVLKVIGELDSPLELLVAQIAASCGDLEPNEILAVVRSMTDVIREDRVKPDWSKRPNIIAGMRVAFVLELVDVFGSRNEARVFVDAFLGRLLEHADAIQAAK